MADLKFQKIVENFLLNEISLSNNKVFIKTTQEKYLIKETELKNKKVFSSISKSAASPISSCNKNVKEKRVEIRLNIYAYIHVYKDIAIISD